MDRKGMIAWSLETEKGNCVGFVFGGQVVEVETTGICRIEGEDEEMEGMVMVDGDCVEKVLKSGRVVCCYCGVDIVVMG